MVHVTCKLCHLLSFNISGNVPADGTDCGRAVLDGIEKITMYKIHVLTKNSIINCSVCQNKVMV